MQSWISQFSSSPNNNLHCYAMQHESTSCAHSMLGQLRTTHQFSPSLKKKKKKKTHSKNKKHNSGWDGRGQRCLLVVPDVRASSSLSHFNRDLRINLEFNHTYRMSEPVVSNSMCKQLRLSPVYSSLLTATVARNGFFGVKCFFCRL